MAPGFAPRQAGDVFTKIPRVLVVKDNPLKPFPHSNSLHSHSGAKPTLRNLTA